MPRLCLADTAYIAGIAGVTCAAWIAEFAAPADVDELLAQPYVKDESKTVKDLVNEVIAKVGENVTINRFCRMEA